MVSPDKCKLVWNLSVHFYVKATRVQLKIPLDAIRREFTQSEQRNTTSWVKDDYKQVQVQLIVVLLEKMYNNDTIADSDDHPT